MPKSEAKSKARPRLFHFAYPVFPHNKRASKAPGGTGAPQVTWSHDIHRVRDGSAMLELVNPLIEAGYVFGETLLNLAWRAKDGPDPACAAGTDPVRRADDLIVLTTRCPLSDAAYAPAESPQMRILPSNTPLERNIFRTLKACFLRTSLRSEIGFNDRLAEFLDSRRIPPSLSFIKRSGTTDAKPRTAYGFLLYAPQLVGADTGVASSRLLVCFAMAGVENWLWARTVRRQMPGLLTRISTSNQFWLVVGRWQPVSVPERPLSLAGWSDALNLELVVVARSVSPHTGKPWQECREESAKGDAIKKQTAPLSRAHESASERPLQ